MHAHCKKRSPINSNLEFMETLLHIKFQEKLKHCKNNMCF